VLAAVQPIEVGPAIDAEQHGLAVDHERAVAVAERGLDDQRKAIGPIVTVAGEQPHALAIALDDQPVAIVLVSWNPSGRSGTFGPRVGMQGSNAVRMRE
jgi:hypothetical protein